MRTVIKLSNDSGEIDRIELADEDATTQAIALAAAKLIAARLSMSVGDRIEVTEEK